MKELLMELQHIFDGLKDKNEIAIMQEYSCNARRYTITLTGKVIFLNFYLYLHLFNT